MDFGAKIGGWGAGVWRGLRHSVMPAPPAVESGAEVEMEAPAHSRSPAASPAAPPAASSPPHANNRYSAPKHDMWQPDLEVGGGGGGSRSTPRGAAPAWEEVSLQTPVAAPSQLDAAITPGSFFSTPGAGFSPLPSGSPERVPNPNPHRRNPSGPSREGSGPGARAAMAPPPAPPLAPAPAPFASPPGGAPAGGQLRRPPSQLHANLVAAAEVQRQRRAQQEREAEERILGYYTNP